MVRWAEIDRQALAVAAAQCIYRYYHPVCNAGDLRWRHAIRLRRENDITSKREGQMIKKLQLLTKLYFNRPFWKKKKTPQLEVWCQIFFKKLNSENSYELVDTDANKPGPLQLPTAMRFFDKLITVCANLLLHKVHKDDRAGMCLFVDCKVFDAAKGTKHKCTDAELWSVHDFCKQHDPQKNTTGLSWRWHVVYNNVIMLTTHYLLASSYLIQLSHGVLHNMFLFCFSVGSCPYDSFQTISTSSTYNAVYQFVLLVHLYV